MHSIIKEILNTSSILDGIPMPVQILNALENQRNAEYISNLGWNSHTGSSVKYIQKSKKF
jgi:hypothetical protein